MSDSCWIETFSGVRFQILEPTPEMVNIEDIAHALSNQCRWTGHVSRFFSVAEHSLWVSRLCEPQDALWGLLHDASEGYLCDLSRPIKYGSGIGPHYREIEERLMTAICERFGLPAEMPKSVKFADNTLLFTEKKQLMTAIEWDGDSVQKWNAEFGQSIADIQLVGYEPYGAKHLFLERFRELEKAQRWAEISKDISGDDIERMPFEHGA
jgi:uncharacterized protein